MTVLVRASNAPRDARRAARLAIRAAAEAAEAAWTPSCMSADEFALWREGHRAEDANAARGLRPCADCPLGYAADMRAQGRCNGTPGGVEEEEHMTAEPIPIQARPVERLHVDETQTRVSVTTTAPCDGCAHEPVCALRASLDALGDIAVRLPRLDPALGLELAGTISCKHFLGTRKPSAWTPERRAAQAERVRQQNLRRMPEAPIAS